MSDTPATGDRSPNAVPALAGLSAIADRYDVLFCDIWGVLHDGVRENAPAGDALERFRAQGGTVVLVTNAPVPRSEVARGFVRKQVRRGAWDAIVSSGDVTLSLLAAHEGGVFHIGPDRDLSLFADLQAERAPMETAGVAVVTGLWHDDVETAEDYRPLLQKMRARSLDLVCANPDRVVHVGDKLLPCAGAIADIYAEIGGVVLWAGKPYAPIYDLALAEAGTLRGGAIDKARILMIGDSVRTDLAGAKAYGLDALFIARGVHRDGAGDAQAVARLLREAGAEAIAHAPFLRW